MNLKELKALTKKELVSLAAEQNLSFNSKYTKEQLIEAIQKASKKSEKTKKIPEKNTKEELSTLTKEGLSKIAKTLKIAILSKNTKAEIIEKILTAGHPAEKPEIKKAAKSPVKAKKGETIAAVSNENSNNVSYFEIATENIQKIANLKLHSLSKEEEKTNFYQTYIPDRYDEDKLVVMAKDPNTVFVYWDLSTETINKNKIDLNSQGVIRLFEIDSHESRHLIKECEIKISDMSAYIKIKNPHAKLEAELQVHKNNKPLDLLISNKVEVPSKYTPKQKKQHHDPSTNFNETRDDLDLTDFVASSALSSNNRDELKAEKDGLWLELKTDLIVYGSTKPGTILTLDGKKITLRPDGTFTIRLSFPDGKQEFSLNATAKTKALTKEIKGYFSKKTETNNEGS